MDLFQDAPVIQPSDADDQSTTAPAPGVIGRRSEVLIPPAPDTAPRPGPEDFSTNPAMLARVLDGLRAL